MILDMEGDIQVIFKNGEIHISGIKVLSVNPPEEKIKMVQAELPKKKRGRPPLTRGEQEIEE